MTHKEFIDFYQGYMKEIDRLLQTKPLEYWIMLFLLSSKSCRISWRADIGPLWISDYSSNSYLGPFLGYRFHPCPLEQITSNSFAAIRKRLELVPLTTDNIPEIAHSGFIIYGFDRDNRMVCAIDSRNNMYSFEYRKNKVRIVQTFIPHPPREVEDPIGKAFEEMYQEIHKGPELIEIAECEYDERGRIIKFIQTCYVEGSDKYRKGIIRFFRFKAYLYDKKGIKENDDFWMRVHLNRKDHMIPSAFFPTDSLPDKQIELERMLQRKGFSFFGITNQYIHDEEGYVTHIVSKDHRTETKIPKKRRFKI